MPTDHTCYMEDYEIYAMLYKVYKELMNRNLITLSVYYKNIHYYGMMDEYITIDFTMLDIPKTHEGPVNDINVTFGIGQILVHIKTTHKNPMSNIDIVLDIPRNYCVPVEDIPKIIDGLVELVKHAHIPDVYPA